jgi:hypothetical protein
MWRTLAACYQHQLANAQATSNPTRETMGFQTEVKQPLQLMIHSLYLNREIFLRE